MALQITPYWQILLDAWREHGGEEGNGADGLTIPFIIGSQQYLPAHYDTLSVRDLLIEMIEDEEYTVYLTYCYNLNELIIGKMDESKRLIPGTYFPYEGIPQARFMVSGFIGTDEGNDMAAVIDNLVLKNEGHIAAGEFSKNNNIWGRFSPKEHLFIQECLAVYNT